jgi:hypothetical protein
MTVRISCPGCNRSLNIPERVLGKKVQCPGCKHQFVAEDSAHAPTPLSRAEEKANPSRPPASKAEPLTDLEEAEAITDQPRRSRPHRAASVAEDDDFDPVGPRRGSKKSNKSNGLLMGLLLGGTFLVLGAGAALAYVFRDELRGDSGEFASDDGTKVVNFKAKDKPLGLPKKIPAGGGGGNQGGQQMGNQAGRQMGNPGRQMGNPGFQFGNQAGRQMGNPGFQFGNQVGVQVGLPGNQMGGMADTTVRHFADPQWKLTQPAGSRCAFQVPGDAQETKNGDETRYEVKKDKPKFQFEVAYADLNGSPEQASKALAHQSKALRDKMAAEGGNKGFSSGPYLTPDFLGSHIYRQKADGTTTIVRLLLDATGKKPRLYRIAVTGSNLTSLAGDAKKFLDSFKIESPTKPTEGGLLVFPGNQWVRLNPTGANCSFRLPVKGKDIGELQLGTHYLFEGKGYRFEMQMTDLPKSPVPAAFELISRMVPVRQLATGLRLSSIAEEPAKQGKVAGRQIAASKDGKRVFVSQVFLDSSGPKTRMYQVTATGPEINRVLGDGAKYLLSFRIDAASSK